jgi:hypothetical protein
MTRRVGKAGSRGRNRLPQDGALVRKNRGHGHSEGSGDKTEPRKLSCAEVRPLLRKFFVGQLAIDDPDLWWSVDNHIDQCQECYMRLIRLEVVVDSNLMADAMNECKEHASIATAESE